MKCSGDAPHSVSKLGVIVLPISPVTVLSCNAPPLRHLAVFAVAHQVSFRRASLKMLDLKEFRSVFFMFAPILRFLNGSLGPPVYAYRGDALGALVRFILKRCLDESDSEGGENIIFSLRCWGTVPEYLESSHDVVAPSAAFAYLAEPKYFVSLSVGDV